MIQTLVTKLSREELIKELMWNIGGNGFGICSVANSLSWALDRPGPGKEDLPSVVLVNAPVERYTDTELRWLVAFSQYVTAKYDNRNRWRRGANLIIIGKPERDDGYWLRKRLSWDHGPMHSKTLLDALSVMLKH